jgi:undecaprenyl-diphosphatase
MIDSAAAAGPPPGRCRRLLRHAPEIPALVGFLVLASAVWGFIALADAVVDGQTQMFDARVVAALRSAERPDLPRGPQWLVEVGRDLTALGGIVVLALTTMGVALYLWLQRKRALMGWMLLAVVSGVIASTLLKQAFARGRPPTGSELTWVFTSSFPSGHSMLSAVVYLTLGAMLAHSEPRRRIKVFFVLVAMLLAGLVGASRVYLGVHYPTDVLGGWVAGSAWALAWWLAGRRFWHQAGLAWAARDGSAT